MLTTSSGRETAHAIGELCIGGDWACAHGDLSTLGHIAQRLAIYAEEPIHCDLRALAAACTCDPDRAAVLWAELRELMYRTSDH